ncbi:bifunctional riboflavin kinase/FAD synthetase [Methylococcus geothermalis]|uniref:Riboflavin biosynthesis protein n=1 Tax=Methylococcus geothermalis TaxID=2681310 RepID=A0A858Q825_9GAMM|nr:bifunctional riboflavin kinase/FAD synthetase [Methylococcus geothermalis]QJD29977.1 bifunctional riboflavin kinase/FAD synthetase [Methylococcus geothermalis]
MRVIHGVSGTTCPSACVASIGNFDGVHLGHQTLVRRLAEEGRRLGLPVAIVLFEPQPREFFDPDQSPPRLMRLSEKLSRLADLPVDWVLLLRFDEKLANLAPEDFVRRILVERLHVRHLIVGDDFRFGRGRAGDHELLCRLGRLHGFTVSDTESVTVDGFRVSSTRVREALWRGDMAGAARLLGRPYALRGRVVHGDQLGRRLGFPTANIELRRENIPVQGVFAVTMSGISAEAWPGVANIGIRPTVSGSRKAMLETHLFDFTGDLYGRRVEVHLHHKLRDEMRFADIEDLKEQIARDAAAARGHFAAG